MFKEAVSSFHHHWKSWTNIFLCCDPIKIDTSINVVFILFFLCFWFCASMRRFWVISMWRQWVLCTSRRCLISYLSVCQCLWCFSPCFVHASVNFPFTILINLRIQFPTLLMRRFIFILLRFASLNLDHGTHFKLLFLKLIFFTSFLSWLWVC